MLTAHALEVFSSMTPLSRKNELRSEGKRCGVGILAGISPRGPDLFAFDSFTAENVIRLTRETSVYFVGNRGILVFRIRRNGAVRRSRHNIPLARKLRLRGDSDKRLRNETKRPAHWALAVGRTRRGLTDSNFG